MNDGDARRRLLQSTDFWQIWQSNDVEGSKGEKRLSWADKTSKGAMKSYSVCWDQATDENCGQVWEVGKIGVRSQLWEELCEREESLKKGELSNCKWENPSETIGKGGEWCSKLNNQLLEERKKYWEDGERHFNPIL